MSPPSGGTRVARAEVPPPSRIWGATPLERAEVFRMQVLTAQELRTMLDAEEDLVVVNVLAPEDFREAHIPGSENVPLDRERFVDEILAKTGSKEAKVVVYCSSESCTASRRAARKLDESGFPRVYGFTGGIQAWQEAGLPVDS